MTKTNNIPKDWKWVKLEDIAKWGSGGTPTSTNPNYYNGEIPWLIIGDLNDGYISSSEKKITELGLKNSSAKLIKPDSVLIAMYGSIGKLGINKIPVTTNQAIAFTEVIYDNTYNKYLFHYLLHIRSKLHSLGKGGTQKNISQTVLKKVDLPLPPLPVQQAIVSKIEELFSELDNGIAQLKTAQQQLKTYRQSVLKWAFEGKLTEEWRLVGMAGFEPSTSKNKKSRKSINPTNHGLDNKLNAEREGFAPPELPEGWKWVKLGNLMESVRNGYSKKPDEFGNYKILRISSVRPNAIDINDIRLLEREIGSENSLNENDLLFTRYNGSIEFVGVCGRVPKLSENLYYPDKLIRCRPLIKEYFHSTYISYAANSRLARQFVLSKIKTTAGQTGISGSDIKEIPIPLPSLEEQLQIVQEIESRLSVADKMEESISASLQQAEALRQSILKRAFEGELIKK